MWMTCDEVSLCQRGAVRREDAVGNDGTEAPRPLDGDRDANEEKRAEHEIEKLTPQLETRELYLYVTFSLAAYLPT